jgi:hypothetical protein
MFKALLRTDGTVTVTGGDLAWRPQREHFLRICTAHFANMLLNNPELTIHDFGREERTVECDEYHFIESCGRRVHDEEYHYCQEVLKGVVKRMRKQRRFELKSEPQFTV